MKKILLFFFIIINIIYANVTGVVFRDLPLNGNSNGVYGEYNSTVESNISGVKVTGIDENGNRDTTFTDENGTYTLTGFSGKVRIEFSNWPSYLKESFSGSSVQFVNAGEEANFALHNPVDYATTDNSKLVTSVYINGKAAGDPSGDSKSLVIWDYEDTTELSYDILLYKKDIGSVWGMAYNKNSKDLYLAAILRRHVGLLDSDGDGYGDVGVIYKYNMDTNTKEEFFRFTNAQVGEIVDDEKRGLTDEVGGYYSNTADPEAFPKIGNIGLGDIDLSPDNKTLYVVNIYEKSIYTIDTATATSTGSIPIPTECTDPDDARPFALKYYDDALYLGVTCVALNTKNRDDLKAMVYRYNGSSFEKIIDFPLTYTKGDVDTGTAGSTNDFQAWVSEWSEMGNTSGSGKIIYPQPLLSDIEFVYRNGKKYMVLSLLDRTGLQTAYQNKDTDGNGAYDGVCGGDVLISSINSDGTATLESGGLIDGEGGDANNEGPDGGEFFYGDYYQQYHKEVALGGMAYIPGNDTVEVNSFDANPGSDGGYGRGGTRFYKLDDGNYDIGKNVYDYRQEDGTMAKATGIGDLELLGDLAPLEIGDRVWFDDNGNGVQDANESGIAGVKLILNQGSDCNNPVAETTTDENGIYYFNDTNVNPKLEPETTYTICIDSSQYSNSKGVDGTILEGKMLTKADAIDTLSDNPDGVDSDAKDSADGLAYITLTTLEAGDNNYSYDIGLTEESDEVSYCIGDRVWLDEDKNGLQDSNESNFTESIEITLLNEDDELATDINGEVVEPIVVADGEYKFCDLAPDLYKVEITPLDGYAISPKDMGDSDTNDSDINETTYKSDLINLQDDNLTIDIGVYKADITYCLGDYIWYDNNQNGVQDDGENGVTDVKITLNETEESVTTDENGKYQFCGLENGDYSLTLRTL